MRPSEWRSAFVLAPIYASLIHAHVERWSLLKAHTAFPALLVSTAQHVTLPSTTLSTTAGTKPGFLLLKNHRVCCARMVGDRTVPLSSHGEQVVILYGMRLSLTFYSIIVSTSNRGDSRCRAEIADA